MFDEDKYVAYITSVAMLFGASRVTPNPGTSVVGLGHEKLLLEQSVRSFKQNAILKGEQYLKTLALQSIAQRKLAATAAQETIQKANPYHDEQGLFTSKEKAVDKFNDVGTVNATSPREGDRRTKLRFVGDVKAKQVLDLVREKVPDWNYVPPDTFPVESIAWGKVKTIQAWVSDTVIGGYAAGSLPNKGLPVGVMLQGSFYILNGNHRAEAQLRSSAKLKAHVIYPKVAASLTDAFWVIGKAERVLVPFASFMDNAGRAFMNTVSSLHTSRVSAYGFTAEAYALGMEYYQITAQLDVRVCPVCREMHGKRFKVADARRLLDVVLRVDNPDDLKSLQPWPAQTKDNLALIKEMSPGELVSNGWQTPPYHPGCRCLLTKFGTVQPAPKEGPVVPAIEKHVATLEEFKAAGVAGVNDKVLSAWGKLVGMSPSEVLALLRGLTAQEYLSESFEAASLREYSGHAVLSKVAGGLSLSLSKPIFGADWSVDLGVVFKDKSLELSKLILDAEDQGKSIAKPFMKSLHSLAKQIGVPQLELKANIDVGGYAWARYGFAPDEDTWSALKLDIARSIKYNKLLAGESLVTADFVQKVLSSKDPKMIWALSDSAIGKKLLMGQQWRGYLDMADAEAMERFIEYLG